MSLELKLYVCLRLTPPRNTLRRIAGWLLRYAIKRLVRASDQLSEG